MKIERILFTLSLILAVLLYSGQAIQAQEVAITGSVVDEGGESLVGVTVRLKGTHTGTISDIYGMFSIKTNQDAILVFSFIGMETKEVKASDVKIVVLANETLAMDEVIVVAYGTTKKNTFTGALAIVDKDRLNTAQVSNISTALQGVASGVQVTNSSGQPGAGATIRIRGVGSINASSSPLFVVDGVPFDGDLSSINPTDIESMIVLKDAASAALYGSRAGNGVVLVTTKSGTSNKPPQINIRATTGWSKRAVQPLELLGTDDWVELRWEAIRNGYMDNDISEAEAAKKASSELIRDMGINPYGSSFMEPVGVDGKLNPNARLLWDDDWNDAMIGTGSRNEINANISGGSDNVQYFLSAGHLLEKGITLGSGFSRTSVRANLSNQTTRWLKTILNIGYSSSTTDFNDSQDSNVGNALTYGMSVASFYPIYKRNPETGEYIYDASDNKIFDFGPYRTSSFATNNQIASLPKSKDQRKRDLISVRGSLDFNLGEINYVLDGLKFKTQYSTDINIQNNHSYNPSYKILNSFGQDNQKNVGQDLQNTSASRGTNVVKSYTFNNILSYVKEIGDEQVISAMVGQELYQFSRSENSGSRESFPLPGIQEPSAGSSVTDFIGRSDLFTLVGLLGRLEYNYKSKYNFSTSFRRDGSSKFHPDQRWSNFWSVGTAWNIEKEDFMVGMNNLNLLKFRVSYGAQGNQELSGFYPYQSIYSSAQIGNSPGLYIGTLANPDLTWETNLNLNIGVDFILYNNRLRGSLEYFQRKSKDLLYGLNLLSSSGYSSILSNIGEMRNNGFELDIKGTLINKKDFGLDLGLNLAHYKNKLTSFPVKEGIQSGTKFHKEGGDIYAFRLVEWAGNTSKGETLYTRDSNKGIVEDRKARGGEASWYLFDENGKKYRTTQYSIASTNDRQEQGSAIPDVYGGASIDVRLYNFTISALFSYSIGGKLYSADYLGNYSYGTTKGRPLAKEMLDRWTPENTDTDLPRLTTASTSNSFLSQSSRHLYDGTYARLKNLAVTYNLPSKLLKRLKMSNASIFFQGENLLTFFGLDGVDPESGGLAGVTSFRYPAVKTSSFGINVTF